MAQVTYEKALNYYRSKVQGFITDVLDRDVMIDALEEEVEKLTAENERLRQELVKRDEGPAEKPLEPIPGQVFTSSSEDAPLAARNAS